MSETIEVQERIEFEQGGAVRWYRKYGQGDWELVDCSAYPDGKPPFIKWPPLVGEKELREVLSHCIYDPIDYPLVVIKLNQKLLRLVI